MPTSNGIGYMALTATAITVTRAVSAYDVRPMFSSGEYDDARWPRFQNGRPKKA